MIDDLLDVLVARRSLLDHIDALIADTWRYRDRLASGGAAGPTVESHGVAWLAPTLSSPVEEPAPASKGGTR